MSDSVYNVSPEVFRRSGFLGPIPLLTLQECAELTAYLSSGHVPPPADWFKGRAATDRILYELSTRPALLQMVSELLGADVVLWGVDVVVRKPGQVHHWHTDIESSDVDGGFVSAWIGLENTSRESTLQVVSSSHRIGKTIQQVYREAGLRRGDAGAEQVLAWAQRMEPSAKLIEPDCSDGDVLLFDGRLWHGSQNSRDEGTRTALLLQFANASKPVFVPDFSSNEWPFRLFRIPRPPVILVRGEAEAGVNRLVPPPPTLTGSWPLVSSVIRTQILPLRASKTKGWKPYKLFRGTTQVLDDIGCHASVLSPGHSPHPPHAHVEEELLVCIQGQAELVIARSEDDADPRIETLTPGMFVYYPAFQHHTVRNRSQRPATYLMLKWTGRAAPAANPLEVGVFAPAPVQPERSGKFSTRTIFEAPTGCLGRLHAHSTRLEPGAGYEAHADPYDVAIVLLAGEVRSQGQEIGPLSVLFFAAGELHDMRNVGSQPAHYLVFEFHGPGVIRKTSKRRDLEAPGTGEAERQRSPLRATERGATMLASFSSAGPKSPARRALSMLRKGLARFNRRRYSAAK